MTKTELRFALDPTNPGQFYACCGLIELFELFGADTLSRFEVNPRKPRSAEFAVTADSPLDLSAVLIAVAAADYKAIERCPAEESVKPVRARLGNREIELDWWLDEFRSKATRLKCWAGRVTNAKLFHELPKLVDTGSSAGDLFHRASPTGSRFGVDPRSAWNALDFGYSPDKQGQEAATFPAVEVLAAFGLQCFRPLVKSRERFTYNVWRNDLPKVVAAATAVEALDGLSTTSFEFSIGYRGSFKYFAPAKLRGEKE